MSNNFGFNLKKYGEILKIYNIFHNIHTIKDV